jgi:hypothetical protein
VAGGDEKKTEGAEKTDGAEVEILLHSLYVHFTFSFSLPFHGRTPNRRGCAGAYVVGGALGPVPDLRPKLDPDPEAPRPSRLLARPTASPTGEVKPRQK